MQGSQHSSAARDDKLKCRRVFTLHALGVLAGHELATPSERERLCPLRHISNFYRDFSSAWHHQLRYFSKPAARCHITLAQLGPILAFQDGEEKPTASAYIIRDYKSNNVNTVTCHFRRVELLGVV